MSVETTSEMIGGKLAIAVTSCVLLLYYLIKGSTSISRWLHRYFKPESAQIREIFFNRITGIFLFGLVPLAVVHLSSWVSPADFGIIAGTLKESLIYWIPVAILIFFSASYLSRNEKFLARYPQIRSGQWDLRLICMSAASWMGYLTAYEFLFRGFLLFACYESFGFWPAIGINLALYMLAHLPKGIAEILGSLPVGLILCLVSLQLGSIWFALMTHMTMALAGEWFSIYHNSQISFVRMKHSRK